MGFWGPITDLGSAARKLVFGYTDKEKAELKPIGNYLSTIGKYKNEQKEITSFNPRFETSKTNNSDLDYLARKRIEELENKRLPNLNLSNGLSLPSGETSDLFIIGFGLLIVLAVVK